MHLLAYAAVAVLALSATSTLGAAPHDRETCAEDNRQQALAVAACTRVIDDAGETQRNRARAYHNRGYHQWSAGQFDRAIADYDEAIRLDPDHALAYHRRGNAWANKQDYDRAIVDYSEAIRLDPKDDASTYNRARSFHRKGELDRSIVDYNDSIRINPRPSRHNFRGLALSAKGDFDRAIVDYSEAIRLDPQYGLAYLLRGDAWRAKNDQNRAMADYDSAIAIYDDALSKNPKSEFSLYGRGIAKLRKGDTNGNADIVTAKTLKAEIAEQMARDIGLTPTGPMPAAAVPQAKSATPQPSE